MEDLKTKGYTVVKNFLNEDELAVFLKDYRRSASRPYPGMKDMISMGDVSYPASQSIKEKIQTQAALADLDIDLVIPYGLYTDTSKMFFMWHQDAGNYFVVPNSYNYLNFYIPIEKPDPVRSGISLVPMDALEASVPEHYQQFVGTAARRFVPENDYTKVYEDTDNREWILPINIETIAVSPELSAGDCLILRGDVFHRTQDNSSKRIAVSIRATKSSLTVSAERLFAEGTRMKKIWLGGFMKRYREVFAELGNDEITVAELVDAWHPKAP